MGLNRFLYRVENMSINGEHEVFFLVLVMGYNATVQAGQCQVLLNALNSQQFVDAIFIIGV